ncbi:2-C-methyl-D-erythritol 4-phosphate cytidylyltransferase [Rheinheimera pacifica]|uniref:2-C-methyl-D-erythritol 4-phosphate cytidylyltransferase n=1 Tax=Rheinheimera pacifica TaxID=173990 RepID=UPI000CB1EA56|nr:2-C-methyl-D-erythritol 4-phosphate cytidylyltransferase [Rheinheimera pacifica]MDR6985249.1 2-C-methyl-D-erythritol 4-phosphate cytidylyltransferase [Rheinheimera pacifica]PKM20987.1 MAG: 2-C-methyl-D-erythritol 4-phosphate cytidylyltransferase [Gammaproteobacteria bacterium HGW-Gammaproteobacteria-15]
MTNLNYPAIAAIVPAAGVGKRMQADRPKQYLVLHGKTILEHSVARLQAVAGVEQIWLALAAEDPYFDATALGHSNVIRVKGGDERMHSVLNALNFVDEHQYPWVLVHDAARPLVRQTDIELLIQRCLASGEGGILACRVRDTMKRGELMVAETVSREHLWHALTPQFFPTALLKAALQDAISAGVHITDEASAMEWAGHSVLLVEGHSDNIKITQPADLALAAFYLEQSS